MFYRNGEFSVEISRKGEIQVRPGDWLSKYSAAIHNDFTHIYEFARKDRRTAAPVPIQNLDMIRAGETLYHLPTYYSFEPATVAARKPAAPRLSQARKKKLIQEAMKRKYNLPGNHASLLSKAIDIIGYADNAVMIAEVAGLIAEGGAIAAAGTVLSIASVFLLPIGATISWVNAAEFGVRQTGHRAVAYATAAWAFGDPNPKLPANIRKNLQFSHGAHEVAKHERAWNKAVDQTMKELDATVAKKRIQKKSYQVYLRALGDNDRKTLAVEIMKGFAKEYAEGVERNTFWTPNPDYPN